MNNNLSVKGIINNSNRKNNFFLVSNLHKKSHTLFHLTYNTRIYFYHIYPSEGCKVKLVLN